MVLSDIVDFCEEAKTKHEAYTKFLRAVPGDQTDPKHILFFLSIIDKLMDSRAGEP